MSDHLGMEVEGGMGSKGVEETFGMMDNVICGDGFMSIYICQN